MEEYTLDELRTLIFLRELEIEPLSHNYRIRKHSVCIGLYFSKDFDFKISFRAEDYLGIYTFGTISELNNFIRELNPKIGRDVSNEYHEHLVNSFKTRIL